MRNGLNSYIPLDARIETIEALTSDVNLYTLNILKGMEFRPGQYFMVSVFGFGEVPISVASNNNGPLQLCIRNVGHVTGAIHSLKEGDSVGIRGPYGNGFDLEAARGRDVVMLAGGIGIVPLRPLINEIISGGEEFGKIILVYGAKRPDEILFVDEANEWEKAGVRVIGTVDCADEKWCGCVGVVTAHLDGLETDFKEACAFLCGPPVMIGISMRDLSDKGMPEDRITTTLEAHMKCGVGKCGHCYIGPEYVCTNGPVYTLKELKSLGYIEARGCVS